MLLVLSLLYSPTLTFLHVRCFDADLMLLNCGAGEDSRESLGQQGVPVNPKGKQPRMFVGRNNAEIEAPKFWPPDGKS